jgi:transcriptional regulator with PAS, ATPase and Fis domain
LKERATDIPLLVSHIIEKHKRNINKQISGISPQAVASLVVHSWPGNIRELENVIQRMMVVCKGEILNIEDLPTEIRGAESETRDNVMDLKEISRESAGIVEKRAILETLSKEWGNITRAAKSLGISRATLQNKMKLYGLRDPKR